MTTTPWTTWSTLCLHLCPHWMRKRRRRSCSPLICMARPSLSNARKRRRNITAKSSNPSDSPRRSSQPSGSGPHPGSCPFSPSLSPFTFAGTLSFSMANEPGFSCHYCENPAESECRTCGRLYCSEHGDDVCLRCMAPEAAVPSAAVYRGSILALVIATLVVVFLLVRPPETQSGTALVRELPTSTAAISVTATPTGPGGSGQATPRPGTQVPTDETPGT